MSWGNPETAREKLAVSMLSPIAFAYGVGSYVRLWSYATGCIKRKRASVPVISVGNVTVGGTGKTPVVIDLAKRLIAAGRKPAILSRGYRRKSKSEWTLVSDGRGQFAFAEESGDEPLMIARRVPEAVVLAGAKRVSTAEIATAEFGCDVLLLDDGFQHIRLMRDLDIVLVDYNDNPERDSLLPAGRLREPLGALNRAGAIIITRVPSQPDDDRLSLLRSQLRRHAPEAAIGALRFRAKGLRSEDETFSLEKLSGERITAFSGIARPESFRKELTRLGFNVESFRAFPDHHWYSEKDINAILKGMDRNAVRWAITTEKDMIKLPDATAFQGRLLALEIETEWIELPEELENLAGLVRKTVRV